MSEAADNATGAGGEGDACGRIASPAMQILRAVGPGLVLGMGFEALAYTTFGATLWLFFGGLALAALLTPALAMAEERVSLRLLSAAGIINGVGAVWLWAAIHSPITLVQWALCYVALAAWAGALLGVVMLLARATVSLRGTGAASAALTVALAVAWLSWPFWLAPWLGGRASEDLVGRLVGVHPLFSINVPLRERGNWLESTAIAYWATNLNQDVFYTPPKSIWPFAAVHGGIGALGVAVQVLVVRSRRRAVSGAG